MMLSQTFYVVDHDDVFGDGGVNTSGEVSDERKRRLYVKATLVNHPFFSQEDFWVQALFQCVTESLAGSGVVSLNFDPRSASGETSMPASRRDRDSDSTERRQRKWYELNGQERAEAASQVHAVIFAQLGALSHSMLEFGCDQSVAVAFVRRLSIQHQLPLSQRTMLLQHLIGRQNSSAVSNTATEDQQTTGSDNEESEPPTQMMAITMAPMMAKAKMNTTAKMSHRSMIPSNRPVQMNLSLAAIALSPSYREVY